MLYIDMMLIINLDKIVWHIVSFKNVNLFRVFVYLFKIRHRLD